MNATKMNNRYMLVQRYICQATLLPSIFQTRHAPQIMRPVHREPARNHRRQGRLRNSHPVERRHVFGVDFRHIETCDFREHRAQRAVGGDGGNQGNREEMQQQETSETDPDGGGKTNPEIAPRHHGAHAGTHQFQGKPDHAAEHDEGDAETNRPSALR